MVIHASPAARFPASETSSVQRANAPSVARRRANFLSSAAMLGAIAAMAATIAGCAAAAGPAPAVRPVMVQVPVLHETPCAPPTLADPALPLAGLRPSSPPADTMRAYAAAVAILKGAVRERDAVLAGCARAEPASGAQAERTP
ncbi:MAG TPA: hypothetical protein VNE82_15905 [Candidatus Binataceae bacterium]|nr:hypothetical protein [Candidatus Binataceae bacterium]